MTPAKNKHEADKEAFKGQHLIITKVQGNRSDVVGGDLGFKKGKNLKGTKLQDWPKGTILSFVMILCVLCF